MGTGYKGNTISYHAISDNLPRAVKGFSYRDGYFGTPGLGKKGYSRHIECIDPVNTASELYNTLALGGVESKMPNNKGVFTRMKDGTVISYREHSSSDETPVVEINIKSSSNNSGVKEQKIHFIKKETNDDNL